MKYSSVLNLEASGIQLVDTLAISLTLKQIVRHPNCSTKEVVRDGLGASLVSRAEALRSANKIASNRTHSGALD